MPILVDIIMIGLLVGVILHSVRLSKSLSNFKELHSEMLPLMKTYAKTLIDTQRQIQELKNVSTEVDHMINSRVPPALVIKNDLDFLISRANDLADHLEQVISQNRQQEYPVVKDAIAKKKVKKVINPTPKLAVPKDKIKKSKASRSSEKPKMESFFLTRTAKKIMGRGNNDAA